MGSIGQETVVGFHFSIIQEVGALVVPNSCAIRAQGELKIGELSGGDHREQAWEEEEALYPFRQPRAVSTFE